MAEYVCAMRTNYFHVSDEDQFMEFMSRVEVSDGTIEILMGTDSKGMPTYGFATTGLLLGVTAYQDETYAPDENLFENFILGLQEIVEPGDAIIIKEVGFSDSGDLSASATVITAFDTDAIDLQIEATDMAVRMLREDKCV